MYLLSGQSLATADWFRPESMALNLEERKSTATITVGPEAPAIQVGAWLRDDQEPGNGIIWRVKSVETQYHTNSRTIQLEHIVNTLRDGVMFGEVTPKTITGNNSATTCTAKKAMQYILGRQDIWTLGTFDSAYSDVTNPYNFNGDGLFAALETVTASLDDAHWEYDLSSLPFKLKILSASSDVDSEMRMSRNIRTIRRTVDRSRMFTRLYPIGENNLHITGDYVSRNEATYGTICKIETESSKKDKAELKRWALERLKNHCEPTVTILVEGVDLSQDTGEPLDRLTICRKCRVPLPEFGTTIAEKITKLSWSDKIREPKKVTVTLANNREDIASIINKQNAKGGGGARAKAKKDEEDHAWIDDTTDHVQLVAEAIIGHGPDGVDWSRVATLGVDGEGIHGRVTRAEGYMVTLAARLDMTEERLTIAFENAINSTRSEFAMTAESLRIGFENGLASTRSEFLMTSESLRVQFENDLASTRSEFQMTSESLRVQFENDLASTRSEFQMTSESLRVQFENGLSSARSEFQMTAESLRVSFESGQSSLRSEFSMTAESLRTSFESADASIRSLVTQTATSWEAKISGVTGSDGKVTAASIAVAINNAGEGVATINASKIYLLGQTIANQITSEYIGTAIANIASLGVNAVTGDSAGFNSVYGGNIYFRSSSGSGYATSNIKDIFLSSIEIRGPVNNVYSLYQHTANDASGVLVGTFSRATTLSGAWSGGKITVTASPQGETFEEFLASGASEWADDYKSVQVPINATWGSSGQYSESTGWKAYVDATPAYSAANPASGAASGRHGTTYDWDFVITRGDGTTKALQIDCSAIYSDARSGYTQGTFTLQTITLQGTPTSSLTLQGSAATTSTATLRGAAATTTTVTLQGSATSSLTLQGEAQTVYEEVSSGGTVYYTAGTATTVYPGNGGSFTVQGSTGPKLFHYGSATLKTSSGTELTQDWYYVSNSSRATQYYNAGSTTKYARGTGYSVTPIGSTSKRLSSVTRYKAGSNVGVLYNAGSIATYYPATETLYKSGSSLTYYPATETLYKGGSNVGILYNAGTIDSTHYYTKS